MTRTTAFVALLACLPCLPARPAGGPAGRLAPAVLLRAQDDPCLRRTLPVNVLDKNGNQVWGLTPADFRATLGRTHPAIVSVARNTQPRRVVILLDASGSMGDDPGKWEIARSAAQDILEHGLAGSSVALLSFAEAVQERTGLTEDRKAISAKLAALSKEEVDGRTALLDAVVEGLALLDPPRVGDVIYAITDAGDNASEAKQRQVAESLASAGVRFFALVFAPPRDAAGYYFYSREVDFIAPTGGYSVKLSATSLSTLYAGLMRYELDDRRRRNLAALLQQLYRQIEEFYRLEAQLPLPLREPRNWKLEVVDARGKRRKDLRVIYPRLLFPCPTDSTQ